VRMLHRQAREFISFTRAFARRSPELIRQTDSLRACIMAALNNILRMVFYCYLALRRLWHQPAPT